MRLRDAICRYCSFFGFALFVVFLTGCGTADPGGPSPTSPPSQTSPPAASNERHDPLRVGDKIRVDFSGAPTLIPPMETDIKGDGTIHLEFIGDIQVAGKTPGEAEHEIQSLYVPAYYTHLNVSVTPTVRYIYVDGEVNSENGGGGRVLYVGPITVTRAIAAAGGFNPFARRTKVKLIRVNGKSFTVNCEKAIDNPELDLPVYPGDKVFVPRRLF